MRERRCAAYTIEEIISQPMEDINKRKISCQLPLSVHQISNEIAILQRDGLTALHLPVAVGNYLLKPARSQNKSGHVTHSKNGELVISAQIQTQTSAGPTSCETFVFGYVGISF